MQIINSYWEERNLNCKSYEIKIEESDIKNSDEIIKKLSSNDNFKNSYTVIKVPVTHLELIHKLEDIGFRFMETQFDLTRNVSNPIPEYLEKISKIFTIEYLPKEKSEWAKVTSLIDKDLFTTDRIYLDYKLPIETSSKRYINWINDVFENKNSWMALIKKNDKPFMFNCCINDPDKKSINYLLAGVFSEHKNSGFGTILPIPTILYGQKNGYNLIESSISSNNLAIKKLYEYYGFQTQNIRYILRKFS